MRCYLLDIYRKRLQFAELERGVYRMREKWNADLVIVEKAGSGRLALLVVVIAG